MKEALRFALAATICAPKLALEDTLRHFDVHVPEQGLFHNDHGESIMDIWKGAGQIVKGKAEVDRILEAGAGFLALGASGATLERQHSGLMARLEALRQ